MAYDKNKFLKIAEDLLKANRIPAAIEEYKNLFQATKDLNFLNILGDLYIRVGDIPKAISSFTPIAEEYANDGQAVKAIAMYKKMQKLAPQDTNLLAKLADLHVKKKLLGDARLYYNQLLEIYKKADKRLEVIKILQALVEINPDNLPSRMELASACQSEGLFTEAHDAYLETGQRLLKLGLTNEAVELFERALSLAYNPNLALKHLVETLVQNDQLERAIKTLKQQIEKSPNNVDLLILLGRTHLTTMNLDSAKEVFIELVDKDPSRYDYLLKIATMFLEEKEFDKAVSAIDPIVDIVLQNKQKRKITNILKEILKQDSEHILTLNCLVNIYQKLEENSNLRSTLRLLVKACSNQGLTYEAITALRELIKLEPSKNVHKENLENLEKKAKTSNLSLSQISTTPLNSSKTSNLSARTDDPNSTKNLMEGMLSLGSSYADAQLQLLEAMVAMDPDYSEARIKLKNSYLQKNLYDQAAKECIEIAKISQNAGNFDEAQKFLLEAYSLSPNKKTELISLGLKDPDQNSQQSIEIPLTLNTVSVTSASNIPELATSTLPQSPFNISNTENLGLNSFEVDLSSIFANAEKQPISTETNSTIPLPFIDVETFCQSNKILDREWKRAIRNEQEISLLAIKFDDFDKKVKDFGQKFAQETVSKVASVIEENINEGGEQLLTCENETTLVLMLPEISSSQALNTSKTIDQLTSTLRMFQTPFSFSISQAIVTMKPSPDNSPKILVEHLTKIFAKLLTANQVVTG